VVLNGGGLNLSIPSLKPGESATVTYHLGGRSKFTEGKLGQRSFGVFFTWDSSVGTHVIVSAAGENKTTVEVLPQETANITKVKGGATFVGELKPPALPPNEVFRPAQPDHVDAALQQSSGPGGKKAVDLSASRCRWVAGPNGGLRTTRSTAGVCATPIWIRARLTKRHWSLSLRRRLPPGRYVLYVRAVDRAGLYDPAFSSQQHNRVSFSVR